MKNTPKRPRILIVDDDARLRDVLKHICEALNCEVATAADGLEAFDLIHKESFKLIISDVRMPHMSGVSLLEAIEKNGLDIPVIMMSGYTDYSEEEIDNLNGVALMEKPFRARQLKELVEEYIPFLPDRSG